MFKFSGGNTISVKLFIVGFLSLVLVIPSLFIAGLVQERERTHDSAIYEVSSSWGEAQEVLGPVLTVPVTPSGSNQDYAYFLPESLTIEGNVEPELRSRGIYDVPLYHSSLKLSGNFKDLASYNLIPEYREYEWDKAYVALGLRDMKGITESIKLNWNGAESTFEPGVERKHILNEGVNKGVSVGPEGNYNFDIQLELNGSQALDFYPIGKETSVTLNSAWNSPSFNGAFLPSEHSITEEGFTASWNVIDLNRAYPQAWLANAYSIQNSGSFGVDLFSPVDIYQKIMRSVKYMILFVGLTFMVFFLIEVMGDRKIHPVQYLLVGFGLVLFYLLLLSLAEHIGFHLAYLVGALAIVGLITSYARALFKESKLTWSLFGMLGFLYVFLYVLLQLVDYSLLFGSLMLFVILAAVMYATRNVDWYKKA